MKVIRSLVSLTWYIPKTWSEKKAENESWKKWKVFWKINCDSFLWVNMMSALHITHGKQKWRFLGLYVAFRLAENVRFHLEFSFESATFAYHGNVRCNPTRPTEQPQTDSKKRPDFAKLADNLTTTWPAEPSVFFIFPTSHF